MGVEKAELDLEICANLENSLLMRRRRKRICSNQLETTEGRSQQCHAALSASRSPLARLCAPPRSPTLSTQRTHLLLTGWCLPALKEPWLRVIAISSKTTLNTIESLSYSKNCQ